MLFARHSANRGNIKNVAAERKQLRGVRGVIVHTLGEQQVYRRTMPSKPVAILDTNIWSRIGEEGSAPRLRDLFRTNDLDVALPPSILLEVLRGSNTELRNRRIEAMLAVRGRRLASEAELCSDDFVGLINRHRPQWMRVIKDVSTIAKHHRYWTKDIWRQAGRDSSEVRVRLMADDGPVEDWIYHLQRQHRQNQLEYSLGRDFAGARVSAKDAAFANLFLGGWDGNWVDLWRLQTGDQYWQVASTVDRYPREGFFQTFIDWIGSRVDLRAMTANPEDFRALWFETVTPTEVRRDWIRAAVRFIQTTMKIKKSNSRDEQHSAYLVDSDFFLSGDAAFIDTLNSVQSQAPFTFAKPILVKMAPSGSTLESIERAISDRPRDRT